jgi:2-oxoglutarate dehydrogenase E1 component
MAKNRKAKFSPVSPVSAEVAELPVVAVVTELPAEAVVAEAAAPAAPAAAEAAPAAAAPAKAAPAKKWPKAGGKCWQVWQACQALADSGQHVSVAHMRAAAVANNWNVSNATQEFYAWRKFVSANS